VPDPLDQPNAARFFGAYHDRADARSLSITEPDIEDGRRRADAPTQAVVGDVAGDGSGDAGAPEQEQASEDEKPAKRRVRTIIEWAAVIGGALLVALVVRSTVAQAFWIPSPSMEPTLQEGDRVLVNKLSYRLHDVHRGDIVVFERPPGSGNPEEDIPDLIKRVIGLPGDFIEARADGSVYINGQRLEEPYLASGTRTANLERQAVPEGHVFVMGDNRGNSSDSRDFGAIDEDLIVGRAFLRIWPLGDVGGL
jgi:signal peptidase I